MRTIPNKPPQSTDPIERRLLVPRQLATYKATLTRRQRQVVAVGEALTHAARVRRGQQSR